MGAHIGRASGGVYQIAQLTHRVNATERQSISTSKSHETTGRLPTGVQRS
jgi:hypothetical protein